MDELDDAALERLRKVRHWTDVWQVRLGLAHWDIIVKADDLTDEEGTTMQCCRSEQYETATIKVARWVLRGECPAASGMEREWTDTLLEVECVHELLHCHTRDLAETIKMIRGFLYPQHEQSFEHAMDRAEEQLVDRLARALVAGWPA